MPPTGMAAPSPVTHFEIIAQRTAKHFKITTKKKPRPRPAQLEDVEPADHPLGQSPVKATKGARGAQVPPVQVAGAGEAVKAPLSERYPACLLRGGGVWRRGKGQGTMGRRWRRKGSVQEMKGAHRALCPRCAKRRLFSTAGSHGSQGPELRTPDAVLNGSCALL